MTVTLNFSYSPDMDGFCQFPPRFDNVNIGNVHDGQLEYANAIADACVETAKKTIVEVAKKRGAA